MRAIRDSERRTEGVAAACGINWIGDGDQRSAGTIQEKVTAAVQSYQSWQRHLGRDINPTELIAKIREAGAKRVKLTAPADIVVGKTQLPKCTGQTVTYGGLEDD